MLPARFQDWFAARGWQPRAASAGAGRTCARGRKRAAGGAHRRRQDPGGLPAQPDRSGRHGPSAPAARARCTRSTSRRSRRWRWTWRAIWKRPSRRWDLPVTVETRTGDTPAARRQRQRHAPPDILLTTPEQLALLLAHPRAPQHVREPARPSCWTNCTPCTIPSAAIFWRWGWRGCRNLAPGHRRVGLSATVADPAPLQRFLMPQPMEGEALSELVRRPGRRQAGDRDQRLGFLCALGGASGAPRHGGCDGGDQATPRPRWSSSTPAARPSAPSRNCGASTTTICPSRCITARWRRSSAARWKRR